MVVVYKIDRLSRSLIDFSELVEVCDRNGVTFVSVSQSFNTTTSMRRLSAFGMTMVVSQQFHSETAPTL